MDNGRQKVLLMILTRKAAFLLIGMDSRYLALCFIEAKLFEGIAGQQSREKKKPVLVPTLHSLSCLSMP